MKRSVCIPSLLMLVLFGGAAQAVTFGAPDNNGHPWVGTLFFQAGDNNFYSCTGTLLSPTVMVTAAHCTIEGGVKNLYTWAKFTPSISFADRNGQDIFAYLDDTAHGWIKATMVVPHPLYAGLYPNTYDVGIVILSQPVVVSQYGQLPTLHFLDTVGKGNTGDNLFTVVGYGMQGYIKPFESDIWAPVMSATSG